MKKISTLIFLVTIFSLPSTVFAAAYDSTVEVLGGGGGGGFIANTGGGGGGGGEYRRCTETLSVQSYTVTVGVGGTADTANGETDSTFSGTGITMTADGGGGTADNTAGTAGTGGVSTNCDTAVANFDGGTPGAGNTTDDTGGGGGGGGGYGGKGGNGSNGAGTANQGGGGGGGGGESGAGGNTATVTAGSAGSGGGGAGGAGGNAAVGGAGSAGTPATFHIVGGGGGGGGDNGLRGGTCGAPGAGSGGGEVTGAGNGCRGEVRIIYVDSEVDATGGTQTTSGIFRIHTFTSSGTFQVTALNAVAPTVTTTAGANGVTSATIAGNISATGGANATARGLAWGTSATLQDSGALGTSTESGSFGTGAFTNFISGLISGTTYYYRAYATNTAGTGFGSIQSFVAGNSTTPVRTMRLFQGFSIKFLNGRLVLYGIQKVTASYRNSYSSTSDLTTYTFAASDIGTASEDRMVVVGVYTSGSTANTSISSATIAGIPATVAIDVPQVGDNQETAMMYAAVPSGTTGDVVVTFSGVKGRAVISVWAVYGTNAPHRDQDGTAAVTTTSAAISGLTVPTNGMGFFMVGHNNIATTGWGWTNADERADTTFENNSRYSAADTSTPGTNTITATVNATVDGANLAGVAFGP